MAYNDPVAKTSEDRDRVDLYSNENSGSSHSHDVFHTQGDNTTTHDYGRYEDGTEYTDTEKTQGNQATGWEQYDPD